MSFSTFPSSSKSKLKISQKDLMCKNDCGHYGNEVQEGFCSVCYKKYKQSQVSQVPRDEALGPGPSTSMFGRAGISGFATLPKAAKLSFDSFSSPLASGFSKFEEKKKQQSDRKSKSFRSVFRKSPTPSPSKSPELQRHGSTPPQPGSSPMHSLRRDTEKEQIRYEINNFLGKFPKEIRSDVVMKVKQCEAELARSCNSERVSIDEISDMAQDFYTNFKRKVDMVPFYRSMTPEDKELLMNFIEKYLTISLYKELFSPINSTAEDEMKDLGLQNRIRQLNWINCQHLDVSLNERDKDVRDLIFSAINAIIGMDSVKSPQDKLASISQCSHDILKALGKSNQAPTSADDFLPSLIYIVIKANPTRLQSNISYISRFSSPSRIGSGEAGYFFTNLCCAVAFIEKLDAKSLSMPEDEFQDYVTGKVVPSGCWEMHFSESLHAMQDMLNVLTEVENRQKEFVKNVDALRQKMQENQERITDQVDVILQRTPLTFKPRKVPTNIDEEDPDLNQTTLPSPLKPEVVSIVQGTSSDHHQVHNNPSQEVELQEGLDAVAEAVVAETEAMAEAILAETVAAEAEAVESEASSSSAEAAAIVETETEKEKPEGNIETDHEERSSSQPQPSLLDEVPLPIEQPPTCTLPIPTIQLELQENVQIKENKE